MSARHHRRLDKSWMRVNCMSSAVKDWNKLTERFTLGTVAVGSVQTGRSGSSGRNWHSENISCQPRFFPAKRCCICADATQENKVSFRSGHQWRTPYVRRASARRATKHRRPSALLAAYSRHSRSRLAFQQRPGGAGVRTQDCRVYWSEALRCDVQWHHRPGNRYAGPRSQGRGHRPVLYVRRDRARAPVAGDHAGLRRHRPHDAQPRSKSGSSHDYPADDRHHWRPLMGRTAP